MEILKSVEDYLLEEIQKYLNLIEQETTDITYRKIIYNILIESLEDNDRLSFIKNKNDFTLEKFNEDYLDFSKNDNIFVLESILNTVKTINIYLKLNIIDNPLKFFFTTLKKLTISDNNSKKLYVNEYKRTKIEDKVNNSIIIKLK